MSMKLKTEGFTLSENYETKRAAFHAVVSEKPEDTEAQNAAYTEMMDAMAQDFMGLAEQTANDKFDELGRYTKSGLSASEIKFYNAITDVGYKEEILLPQETIDRIFEDLTQSHPLLQEIGLRNAGLRLKFIKSDTTGSAVWGQIFGKIEGQLDASFAENEDIQSKLTCFVVVPNDLIEMGPNWVERFVRTQIVEEMSYQLVIAFASGNGKDKPVGLDKDVHEGVTVTGGVYPDKTSSGTLTFADAKTTIKELTGVMNALSTKESGKRISIDGRVILICNPAQAWALKAQYTIQNANGVFITALPFGVRVVESEGVAVGKTIAFVTGRYDAYMGGGTKIKAFDQTLAIEDCTLYTAKAFYYGKAHDNKAALVYDLDPSLGV